MAAEKLSVAQVRALRILADHEQVMESSRTSDDAPCISWQVARTLRAKWLIGQAGTDRYGHSTWSIRSKGRQVLAEHDAEAGGR